MSDPKLDEAVRIVRGIRPWWVSQNEAIETLISASSRADAAEAEVERLRGLGLERQEWRSRMGLSTETTLLVERDAALKRAERREQDIAAMKRHHDEVEDEAARLRRAEALLRSGWDGEVEDTEVEGLAQTSQVSETPQGFDAAGIERHAVERLEKCVQGYIHHRLAMRCQLRIEAQQVAAREMNRVLAENKLLRAKLEAEVERLTAALKAAEKSEALFRAEWAAQRDELKRLRAALRAISDRWHYGDHEAGVIPPNTSDCVGCFAHAALRGGGK